VGLGKKQSTLYLDVKNFSVFFFTRKVLPKIEITNLKKKKKDFGGFESPEARKNI
jgi:hypothetical protein